MFLTLTGTQNYGGESVSISRLEEVSYVPYIDRNSY
jgi:hypothetical protein